MDNDQKKIQRIVALANSDLVPAVIDLLRDAFVPIELVGSNEFETVVNAVRMDEHQNIMNRVLSTINKAKSGELINDQ